MQNADLEKKLFVEPIKEEFLDGILRIEEESFSERWSRASFEEAVKNKNGFYRFYCLSAEHCVLGYVGIVGTCGEGEIVRAAVDRNFRKCGLGSFLFENVIEREKKIGTKKLFLEVRVSNEAAIRLYEKNGFVRTGLRSCFYRKPIEDALLMEREI